MSGEGRLGGDACTAKKETTPPQTDADTLTAFLSVTHPSNPVKPLLLLLFLTPTDAQRLTRAYCGLMQKKSTVKKEKKKKHTEANSRGTVWMAQQTDGRTRPTDGRLPY